MLIAIAGELPSDGPGLLLYGNCAMMYVDQHVLTDGTEGHAGTKGLLTLFDVENRRTRRFTRFNYYQFCWNRV